MPIYLVGAGPGDPDLLTVKAARLLAAADIVLHDSLIDPRILNLATHAILVDVGKRCGKVSTAQSEINRLLCEAAQRHGTVIRLKGGDPMIFGRATEELAALAACDIPYEIIPGITAATAAAAVLGLSLTQRRRARSLHFITGHGVDGLPAHDWTALARTGGTIAVYMGSQTLPGLATHLIEAGMDPAMPALAAYSISLPAQHIVHGTISSLPRLVQHSPGPALLLIGETLAGPVHENSALSMPIFQNSDWS